MGINTVNPPPSSPLPSVNNDAPQGQNVQNDATKDAQLKGTKAAQTQAADAASAAKGAAPAKDVVDAKGAQPLRLQAVISDAPPPPPQTPDAQLKASLDAFRSLAATLGAFSPNAGTPVAPQFSATLSVPAGITPMPSVAYGPEVTTAVMSLTTMIESGQLKLSPNVMRRLEARAALVSMPQAPAAQQTTLAAFTPSQQAAMQRIAQAFAPIIRGLSVPPRSDPRFLALRHQPTDLSDIDDPDALLAAPMPSQLRALLASALEGLVEPPPAGTEQESGQRMGSDNRMTDRLVTTGAPGDPMPDLDPITIPDASVVAMEGSLRSNLGDLAGCDVEAMCMIVMFELGRDSELDLKDALNEMKRINNQKQAMRQHIAHLKDQQIAAKEELRTEWKRRSELDPLNLEYYDKDFSTFCEDQQLYLKGGTLGEELPASAGDEPVFGMSPNMTYEAKSADQTLAIQLNMTSGDAASLRRIWEDDPEIRLKWGTMNEWLVGDPARGGLGLRCPSSESQSSKVAQYIHENDPAVIAQNLSVKFALSLEQVTQLRDYFKTKLTPTQQEGGFEAWLQKAPPNGLGLVANDAGNAAKVRAFLAPPPAAAAPAAATAEQAGNARPADHLKEKFHLNDDNAKSLAELWTKMPDSWHERYGDIDNWIAMPRPEGAGIAESGTDNDAKVTSFLLSYASVIRSAGSTEQPYTFNGQTMTQEELYNAIRAGNTGGAYTSRETIMHQMVNQAFERIPAGKRTELESMLKGCVWAYLMQEGRGGFANASDKMQLHNMLVDYIKHASPDPTVQQQMLNYVELRWAEASRDLETSGGVLRTEESWLWTSGIMFRDDSVGAGDNHVYGLGNDGAGSTYDTFLSYCRSHGVPLSGASFNRGGDGSPEQWMDDGKMSAAAHSMNEVFDLHEGRFDARIVDPAHVLPAASPGEANAMNTVLERYERHHRASRVPDPMGREAWPRDYSNPLNILGKASLANPRSVSTAPLSEDELVRLSEYMGKPDNFWTRGIGDPLGIMPHGTDAQLQDYLQLMARQMRDHGTPEARQYVREMGVPGGPSFSFTLPRGVAGAFGHGGRGNPFGPGHALPPGAAPTITLGGGGHTPAPAPAPTGGATTEAHDPPPPAFDTAAAARSLEALRGGLRGPSHTDGLREMSLAQLDNEIETWNGKKDSLSELGEEQSLRLQMLMDRRSKAYTTLSNMMKKWSDTEGAIIANIK